MVCCKLDKIDKIFISILSIFVTFICVFNTFCYASTNLDYTRLDSLSFSSSQGVFNSNIANKGKYYLLEEGETYTIYNNNLNYYMFVIINSLEIPAIGVSGDLIGYIRNQEQIKYTPTTNCYLYVYAQNVNEKDLDNIIVTITDSFDKAITQLTDNVGFNLWETFDNLLPYVLVVVSVSLGFYFILHAIREVSKGRDV